MTMNTKHEKTREDVLTEYNEALARWLVRWKPKDCPYKDVNPPTPHDVIFLRAIIHPTSKKESIELTRNLIEFICDREICTAQEIYDHYGYSDKPVLKRLKIFQQHGLVRRESKKWYLATPRMQELRKKYMRQLCK